MKKYRFHYLVRGIILVDGKVLLAHQIKADNTFLPGGHIEHGENAKNALVREIEEELGMTPVVGRFIGAVEHAWVDDFDNHEINLLFEVFIPGLDSSASPQSNEGHLEFIWSRPEDLEFHHLLPGPMIGCLKNWRDGCHVYWGSSIQG